MLPQHAACAACWIGEGGAEHAVIARSAATWQSMNARTINALDCFAALHMDVQVPRAQDTQERPLAMTSDVACSETPETAGAFLGAPGVLARADRKSTRLNSSH